MRCVEQLSSPLRCSGAPTHFVSGIDRELLFLFSLLFFMMADSSAGCTSGYCMPTSHLVPSRSTDRSTFSGASIRLLISRHGRKSARK